LLVSIIFLVVSVILVVSFVIDELSELSVFLAELQPVATAPNIIAASAKPKICFFID